MLLITQLGLAQSLVLDTSFVTGTGFDLWSGFGSITVDSVMLQPDNKIIVVGQYINYNGSTSNCITRLNANGTKDFTFTEGAGTNAGIWGCLLQTDGKIIIYGGFTSYNGVVASRIARLNTNGTRDATFVANVGPNDFIEGARIQADGKLIVVGSFTTYNGTTVNRVARLNTNGSLDTSFNAGTASPSRLRDVVIQADGKVIIGGDFSTFNGAAKNRIVRLNTNGSIDDSYNIGTGPLNNVWTMALQNDGKLIIGGEFQAYNGVGRNRIARINTDGTLDTTFTIGTGANSNVMSLLPQSNGKIYIGGSFTTFNGIARGEMARLNSDGSLDTTVTIGNGFNSWVKSIAEQPDGKLLIGGVFTTYDGTTKNRILRLIPSALSNEDFGFEYFKIYPNPATSQLFIENSQNIERYTLSSIDGKLIEDSVLRASYLNIEHLQNGIYILTLFKDDFKITRKFTKN